MPVARIRIFRTLAAALSALALCATSADATSRIKDLANIEGVRQNQLIGYGLVVGLNGTGDTLNNIPFTKQSLQAMLERLGVNIRGANIRTGNVAAVMVTANLPAFGTQGTRIDVTVSALGDAKSLQGGTLLVTPLLGADGNVYAVGQGSLAIGGLSDAGGQALGTQLEVMERDAIIKALEKTRYNKTAAAKLLGMSFRALRYRIKKLGIE